MDLMTLLEVTAKKARKGDDRDKMIAAMLYTIMGAAHGGSLPQLLELMTAHSRREVDRLTKDIGAATN